MTCNDSLYGRHGDLDKPLYTADECITRIKAIDDAILAIQSKPVSVSVPGAGSVSYTNQLLNLQNERGIWEGRLKEARNYENASSRTSVRSSLQGPKQVLE